MYEEMIKVFNEKNKNLSFRHNCFWNSNKKLKGVTQKLPKIWSRAEICLQKSYSAIFSFKSIIFYPPANFENNCPHQGIGHGEFVDKELSLFYSGLSKKIHCCSLLFINFLAKMKWKVLWTQLGVFDSSLELATSIDMICYCPLSKRLIILEIKTANDDFNKSFQGHNPNSLKNHIFKYKPYNYFHLNQLQLSIVRRIFDPYLFKMRIPKKKRIYGLVRIHKNCVIFYESLNDYQMKQLVWHEKKKKK